MPKPKISVPNQFKKIKSDKPKTKREDRVEEKEEIIIPFYKVEPWSTSLFHLIMGIGCAICFAAFDIIDFKIILKFFASIFISYVLFEEFPGLYRRFTK